MTQTAPEPQDQPTDGTGRKFEDSLLDELAGEWRLQRKVGSRLEENFIRAEWVLNSHTLRAG